MNTNDILKEGSIHVLDKNNELKVFGVIGAQDDYLENRDSAGHEAHDGAGIGHEAHDGSGMGHEAHDGSGMGHEAHDGSGMGHEAGDPGHFSTFEQEKDIYSAKDKNQNLSLKSMIELRKKRL